MLFLWIFGNNVEDSMGPVKYIVFYLLGGLAATAGQIHRRPGRAVPSIGASGAVAAVLGGYILLFPKARVVTVIFIVFFFTIIELPALLILGFWFVQQALFGYFDLASGGSAGRRRGVLRPHRRLRVRADRDQAVRGRAQAAAAAGGRRPSSDAHRSSSALALAFTALLAFLTAVRDLRDRPRRAVRDLADRARAVLLRHLRRARAEALRPRGALPPLPGRAAAQAAALAGAGSRCWRCSARASPRG